MRTIWLASYPKSGNTWFRILVANLSSDDGRPADINELPEQDGIASARQAFDQFTLLDSSLLTYDEIDCLRPLVYEQAARRAGSDSEDDPGGTGAEPMRFIKVHDAYTDTAKGEPLMAGARGANGAIVIVRDPRDVASSLAHHKACSLDAAIAFMGNEDATFSGRPNRRLLQFRQRLLTWSGHIASWIGQTDIPIHLIRYEDMKSDTAGVLGRALAFAQRKASAAQIERAVRLADFSQLQAQERAKGFREAPPSLRGKQFFRRGIAGAWRSELTADQIARIESDHGPMMQRLGYEPVSLPKLAQAG